MTIRVISAAGLSAAAKSELEKVFASKHPGEKVSFSYELDPRLIGGVLVIDGGKYYDCTVKNQLVNIRQKLNG